MAAHSVLASGKHEHLKIAAACTRRGGRDGAPRLAALAYVALGDGEAGKRNVHDCYRVAPSSPASSPARCATRRRR